MILECKSCQKKFIVPDNAIPSTGRLVQCSSCGNKWTEFPVSKKVIAKTKTVTTNEKLVQPKAKKEKNFSAIEKKKKKVKKKNNTINLFKRIFGKKTWNQNWRCAFVK